MLSNGQTEYLHEAHLGRCTLLIPTPASGVVCHRRRSSSSSRRRRRRRRHATHTLPTSRQPITKRQSNQTARLQVVPGVSVVIAKCTENPQQTLLRTPKCGHMCSTCQVYNKFTPKPPRSHTHTHTHTHKPNNRVQCLVSKMTVNSLAKINGQGPKP